MMKNLLAYANADEFVESVWAWCQTEGIKIIIAIIALILGFAVINVIVGWIKTANVKHGLDKTLGKTLRKAIS